jgi:hypothetical protein
MSRRPFYLEMNAVQVEGGSFCLEMDAMKMKGVGQVPRESSLSGSGCHEDEKGGTRPKGDPSTWKWVP